MEITIPPIKDQDRIFELEMHSVLNILNVIVGQLELVRILSGHASLFDKAIDGTQRLAEAIHKNRRNEVSPAVLKSLHLNVETSLNEAEQLHPDLKHNREYLEYKELFEQIFNVLDYRIDELDRRWENSDQWERFKIETFHRELVHFLGVVEKNSRGRYRIVYNIAEQDKNDYLVHFNIDSDLEETLVMPLLVKDTIRDLIANARKYTDPGGRIDSGLTIRGGTMRFVIQDTGRGIPEEEIEDVVQYGHRGSNILEQIRTMGNGLGLTKAHYVIDRFDGRLWIDSVLNEGTTISFEIPIPEHCTPSQGRVPA